MEQKLTPRWWIIKLTGLLFAAYSAYNVFILIRDAGVLPNEGKLITAVVAFLFGLLAVFAWTSEVKNIRFLMIRRTAFIIIWIAIILLKLRLAGRAISNFNFSELDTVLYGISYFTTLAALVILFIYYGFIVKGITLYPKLSVILPVTAMILFLCSLALEAVLFIKCNIGLEASALRTVVMRPVFYLGLTGLSAYFLFPPPVIPDGEGELIVDELLILPDPPQKKKDKNTDNERTDN